MGPKKKRKRSTTSIVKSIIEREGLNKAWLIGVKLKHRVETIQQKKREE